MRLQQRRPYLPDPCHSAHKYPQYHPCLPSMVDYRLFNISVITRKRLDLPMTLAECRYPPCSRDPGREGGNISYLILYCGLSYIRIILLAHLTAGCIDDKVDFTVHYSINNIRAPFVNLENVL